MKILQKQFQIIWICDNIPWSKDKKFAVKYRNSDKFADYLASKHINWINRDIWVDSVDIKPKDVEVITFKKFREIY